MYSEAYKEAKKEFVNCLCMSIFGLGIPIVIAIKEWLPIMREEKRKALRCKIYPCNSSDKADH